MQRIIYDPQTLVWNLVSILETIADVVSASIILTYILTLNFYIGLSLIAVLIICALIESKRIKTYRKNRKAVRKASDKLNTLTTEIIRSEKDIKSLGLEDKLSEVSKEAFENYMKAEYKTSLQNVTGWSLRNFIIEISSVLILILGVTLVQKSLLTVAAFMIVYSNSGSMYNLVWVFGTIADKVNDIKICSDRMFALFNSPDFKCEQFGNVNLENVKGEIEFKDVTFTYVEYEKEDEKQKLEDEENKKDKKKNKDRNREKLIEVGRNKVLDNLSFKIQPNTSVAFVGKSGSGKSTILSLISKMYEVDSGEVLIDGVNINDLNKDSIRKTFSLVNQFPYIFDITIKENLLLAKKDATDQELFDAIENASLTEFICSLRNGINTKVGEGGIKLSGGQKQRLAIARALLRKSSIILFDESTSSLDNFAQEHIKKSIDGLKGKSTVVIVAHRLSTIKDVDKIFFLEKGKIVDSGTFNELFKKNKEFKRMFLTENLQQDN